MLKKLISLILISILSISLVGCKEEKPPKDETPFIVSLKKSYDDITLYSLEETIKLAYTTNDELGVSFSSSDENIFTVDNAGNVTAVGFGTAVATITSKTDSSVSVEVQVIVHKTIELTSEFEEVVLKETESLTITYTSNDEVIFASTNTDIFVVDEFGVITAKENGEAYLLVTSTYDDTIQLSIAVTVRKLITLDVITQNVEFVVGDDLITNYESNDEVEFATSDSEIVQVSPTGVLSARNPGEAIITVTSTYDETVSKSFSVKVYSFTETLKISGNNLINIGMSTQLDLTVTPDNAYDEVIWESSNPSVAIIDEFGNVTALTKGITSITVKSVLDETIVDTFEIEVLNIVLVDASKNEGDTLTYLDVDLEFGINLFNNISSAMQVAEEDSVIYVLAGNYFEDILVNKSGITILGEDGSIIDGVVTLSANNITITNFDFVGTSKISNTIHIENFDFSNNIIQTQTSETAFLSLFDVSGITIIENEFDVVNRDFIEVNQFVDGDIIIEKNIIANTKNAISISAGVEYEITAAIYVIRNTIENSYNAIKIDLLYGEEQKNIVARVRFNSIKAFSNYAALSNVGNTIDFTLNYWGTTDLEMASFLNIDADYLRGNYPTEISITKEEDLNPNIPISIEVINPIDEMMIGDNHKLEYRLLPIETDPTKIKFITSNPDVLGTNKFGYLTAYRSGNATITVRSSIDFGVNTKVDVKVTTFPGLEFSTSHVTNDIVVGDIFSVLASPFPIDIENAEVEYSSSDILIATVNSSGIVTATGPGLVTITANLKDDPTVTQDYMVNVYSSLDENNLMDYLSMNQVSYSTPHEWIAYGFQYNYNDIRYESVSRYYFDDVVINQEKIVPVSYGIRPGELMDPLPSNVTPFNNDNIYWVVVHDTASAATGSNALAHANYLYNGAMAGTALWVSWHYTIDDSFIYQHLPEVERGYHAGDGSTLPTEGSYFGGGNRNGVGIEMAINDDGDMFRTWQRTAKLVVDILVRNNMPRTQMAYHNDFSGKDCPNTLRNAGLIPLFEIFADVEYRIKTDFANAQIQFQSNDLEYLDNNGRIIKMPDRALTVSYSITVTENGVTSSQTFYTYLPGTVK